MVGGKQGTTFVAMVRHWRMHASGEGRWLRPD
eukprot:CAMPEP_0194536322 /NCGR_PEP_ID=MMETSP0253-20130528/75209_1 /TAXON_ID=2966 /ORGANISM="Noctiluca scintillans" /LENGTH=31 /DNA_ID= /DNA_START= /DNA_END= /DNA_ORIENTATION=